MSTILVITEAENGELTEGSRELLSRARELADARGLSVTAVGFGSTVSQGLAQSSANKAVIVQGVGEGPYSPEVWETAVHALVQQESPVLVLCPNTTLGMDLGSALAARTGRAAVANCMDISLEDNQFVAKSQVYGGKLVADVVVPDGSVVAVIPGSWAATGSSGAAQLSEARAEASSGIVVDRVIEAESGGDADITKADILVSVGRGIQDPDNLELADELAEAIGGVVSCSRPVVDAGWLPRARQVGKSGKTVKPKLYLALGISGAPEHLQGMKDAELIVAVNSDPSAPIFEVAHYGATVDILELMPALSERLQGGA